MSALVLILLSIAAMIFALLMLSAWSRIRFARQPGSFRCRLGHPTPIGCPEPHWRFRRTRARWVGDVLLVQCGILHIGVNATVARIAPGAAVESVWRSDARRLGKHPIRVLLATEPGGFVEVTVAEPSRTLLVGPFLTAAVQGLPSAPHEQGM